MSFRLFQFYFLSLWLESMDVKKDNQEKTTHSSTSSVRSSRFLSNLIHDFSSSFSVIMNSCCFWYSMYILTSNTLKSLAIERVKMYCDILTFKLFKDELAKIAWNYNCIFKCKFVQFLMVEICHLKLSEFLYINEIT